MDEYQKMKHMMDEVEKRWNITFSSGSAFSDFRKRFKHEAFNIFEEFYEAIGCDLSKIFFQNTSMILASDTIISIDENNLCNTIYVKDFITLLYAFLIPIFSFMDKVEQLYNEQEISEALKEIDHFSSTDIMEKTFEDFITSVEAQSRKYPEDIFSYLICMLMNYYILNIFNNTLVFSNALNFRASIQKNRFQLMPKGAKILDEQIVNQDLLWLEKHPISLEFFKKSLESYLMKEQGFVRNTLDNLRYSLEQLLKDILKNKKSLENNKIAMLSWLKVKGVHVHIRNMVETLLSRYGDYMNDVKHGEDYSTHDVEFMIYQTGIFMRLLLQTDLRYKNEDQV